MGNINVIPENMLDQVPDELIQSFALQMSIKEINNFCESSNRINNIICRNNEFWKLKYIHDFGQPEKFGHWKSMYQEELHYKNKHIRYFGESKANETGTWKNVYYTKACKYLTRPQGPNYFITMDGNSIELLVDVFDHLNIRRANNM